MFIDLFFLTALLVPKTIEATGIGMYWYLVSVLSFCLGAIAAYLLESLYLIHTVLVTESLARGSSKKNTQLEKFGSSLAFIHHLVFLLLVVLVVSICTMVATRSATMKAIILLLAPYGVIIGFTFTLGPVMLKRQYHRFFGDMSIRSVGSSSAHSAKILPMESTRKGMPPINVSESEVAESGSFKSPTIKFGTKSCSSLHQSYDSDVGRVKKNIDFVENVAKKVTRLLGFVMLMLIVSLVLEYSGVRGSMILQCVMRVAVLSGLIIIEYGLDANLKSKYGSSKFSSCFGSLFRKQKRVAGARGAQPNGNDRQLSNFSEGSAECHDLSSVGSLTDGLSMHCK